MTDNDIIKALECCKKGDCKNCTFDECTTGLLDEGIALSLINRLIAENSNLTSRLTSLQNDLTSAKEMEGNNND